MAKAVATGEIDAPVERLYALLEDFGAVPWMKGVTKVELEGDGVGMVRRIYAGGDEAILEQLEHVDPDARQIGYTITQNNPLPVEDYHATCTAFDLGGGRSRLEWACTFTPAGVDEAAATAQVEGMYGVLISWVKDELEQG